MWIHTHPHRSHSTCPPLSSSPHAHSFVIGPAVIKHTHNEEEEEEEEEDLFVFNDTIEGPRAPAVKPGRITQA